MVDRLVQAGHEVTVLVRMPESRAAATGQGFRLADTAADTVRGAEVVISVVLTDEQIRLVFLGSDGAIAAMDRGAVLVQHTTSDPLTATLLADAGADRAIRVLDAALSGSPQDVTAGMLTLWIGGDEAVVEEYRALLETYASPVMFVGPLGNGQRVKLVNNALLVAHVGLAVDSVRIAGSLGIDEPAILAALQHGSGASRGLGLLALGGGVESIGGVLGDLMRKDIAVVREVARRNDVDLGVVETVLSSDAVVEKVLRAGPDVAAR
jgi:3-hydroxyisobutyrate dehydrogenase-like beta-hydroxyacid dehydrogenase